MTLNPSQTETYRTAGHLTIDGVFGSAAIFAATADAMAWAEDELTAMGEQEQTWHLDLGVKAKTIVLRCRPFYGSNVVGIAGRTG